MARPKQGKLLINAQERLSAGDAEGAEKLAKQALAEKNDMRRIEIYREADQLMIKDAPVVPLWYDEVIRLVNPSLQNFSPNGLNLLELRKVFKK